MRVVRVFAVAAVAALGLALVAPSTGASVPSKANTKFCKAVSKISSDVANNATNTNRAEAKALANSVRKAANSAPSSVKSAMQEMAKYYDKYAKAGNNPAALAADLARFGKAAATFSKYYNKNCLSVPDTTTGS